MLLFISISAFSQEKIQWSGAVSNDMSNNLNWLKIDGSSPINPAGNKLIIKNKFKFNVEISTNPIVASILQILIDKHVITDWEINSGFITGTTPILFKNPELSSDQELSVNSITISNDNGLSIKTVGKLTVADKLVNEKNIIIKSDDTSTGSLITNGSVTNTGTGTMTVERWIDSHDADLSDGNDNKWHLVSSPVTGAKSGAFSGHFLNYYTPNDVNGRNFHAYASKEVSLEVGKGYITRYDGTLPNSVSNIIELTGTFNTGDGITSPTLEKGVGNSFFLLPEEFNLVGNPYPSSIDWHEFQTDNSSLITTTLYYYVDEGNGVVDGGNAGTVKNGWQTYNISQNNDNRYIGIGQGFGVSLKSGVTTGNLIFNNDVRTHTHTAGSGFNKKGNTIHNSLVLKTVSDIFYDEISLRFNEISTVNFDDDYDAYKFNSFGDAPTPSFISADGKRLARCETPSIESIDLGFNMSKNGEVTFSLSNVQDFDEIILEDKSNNTFTDLTKNTYSFQHSTDDAETGRFTLHFKKETLSEVEETVGMKVYSSSNNIFIQSNRTLTNATVNLFNTNGQLILSKNYSSLINEQINTNISSGVYLIEVSSNENRFTTRINIKH